jgi:hypothetical protein
MGYKACGLGNIGLPKAEETSQKVSHKQPSKYWKK